MNLRFIETFVCVARLRSFRMAAERLNTSQAAVSNRIASLEDELGIKLFERDTRSVRLTTIGHAALAKAEKLMEVAADFENSLSDPTVRSGVISIGAIDPIAYSWLPGFMDNLTVNFPAVAVNLSLDNSLNLKNRLADGEIELAMMMGPILDDNLINIELFSFDCIWVRSPKLHLADKPSVFDVSRHPLLAYSRNSAPDQVIRQYIREAGTMDARIFNVSSFAAVIRLAIDGMGLGPLPVDIIRPQLDSGELVVIDADLPRITLPCHAVFPTELKYKLPGALAQIARDEAAAYFARQPKASDK